MNFAVVCSILALVISGAALIMAAAAYGAAQALARQLALLNADVTPVDVKPPESRAAALNEVRAAVAARARRRP